MDKNTVTTRRTNVARVLRENALPPPPVVVMAQEEGKGDMSKRRRMHRET
jgi:hypothetical protein